MKEKLKIIFIKNRIIIVATFVLTLIGLIGYVSTHAYFEGSISNNLFSGKVTNVSSSNDIEIFIYKENRDENGEGTKSYIMVDKAPGAGYILSDKSSCDNGSIINLSDDGNFNVLAKDKDVCNIYYDVSITSDITVNLFKEKLDSNGVGLGIYELTTNVPDENFEPNYDGNYASICSNDAVLNINDDNSYSIITSGKTKCDIYYKLSTTPEVVLNIYRIFNTTCASDINNYEKLNYIPKGRKINEEFSNCTNNATYTYDGNDLIINNVKDTICNIYFD